MGRFGKSFATATLVTFWLMCFVFGGGTLFTLAQGGDVVAYAGQSIIVGFVLWGFLTYVFYDLNGWIEERNKPRERPDSQPTDTDNKGGGTN
jgi:hypothetical protein